MGETDARHTSTGGGAQTVLVVDDRRDLADLYTTWLEGSHDVRTAYGGKEALEKADGDVDIVFLDRRMSDMSGEAVLERIRERDLGCRVVMVTAVDPDFDIVEMPVDDYITKPLMREDLQAAVADMQEREAYAETDREYLALASKKATLDARTIPSERRESEAYQEMARRVDELADRADTDVGPEDDLDALSREFFRD